MTTINSLEIRGIRSFTPYRTEFLEFEKPLTLIVGKNGSGKTTLVESLKAVTSGILPPGQSKGRTFLFNNKLNKSSEVKASIKITFNTHTNETVSASRSYSVTTDKVDPKKLTFKGTENVLNVIAQDGKKKSLALKTTDMDMAVPLLMGMSKALLDNVIFCHQDENNWPLDDPSKIKSRFDDLLETSRYTKALQSIQRAKREQEDMIILKKSKLDAYKSQILQIADLKKQLETSRQEISKTKAEIDLTQKHLSLMNERMLSKKKEFEESSSKFNEYCDAELTYQRLKKEFDTMHEQLSEIYEEPLDQIRGYYTALSNELEISEVKGANLAKSVELMSVSLSEQHEKLRKINSHEGNLIVWREKYSSNSKRITEITSEISQEFAIKLEDLDEETIQLKIDSLFVPTVDENILNEETQNLENELKKLQASLLNTTGKIAAFNVMLKTVTTELKEHESVASEFETVNQHKNNLNKDLETLGEDIKTLENQLNDLYMKKEDMLCKGFRMKNMIMIKTDINKEEITSAIKFLNYILANDSKHVESYNKVLNSLNLDENKLIQAVKRIFDELFINDDKVLKDIYDAVNRLYKSSKIKASCGKCGTEVELLLTDMSFEPYNELIRILTNNRIKEYIKYFEKVLTDDKDQGDDGFEINEYNMILHDITTLKQNLLNKKTAVEVKTKDLQQTLIRLEKISEATTKLAKSRDEQAFIIAEKDKITTETIELQTHVDSVNNKLRQNKSDLNTLQNTRNLKYTKFKSMFDELLSLNEINKEIQLRINECPTNISQKIKTLHQIIDRLNEGLKATKDKQTALLNELKEKRRLYELLVENITYKEHEQTLLESQSRLEQLKSELSGKDVKEIRADYDKIVAECSALSHKIATLNGMLISREENAAKFTETLNSAIYTKAQSQYMETYIELKSHIVAKTDLDKYYKYLESSLHNYHLDKINHINSSLKRIWREVYTGTHIDYIQIQSKVDKDVLPTEISSHSYSYRVVMVTPSGVELDMKGHCSAGERILSSLVVRMALIECFSAHCTILALDEPTTNLDRDNIQVSIELIVHCECCLESGEFTE
ncbi:AAA domain protein [Theileria parva strain Muguga]|uniref:AAA domain protein n=1 Tax=Theileria parva strain Muguga TaxID=333668 RepID=UPI001C61B4D4|nr:AAA domain protein [Theileria parva strain Muguga]EAN32440.2 AAA domain protein [Theileria parva strain Muguga]